MRIGLPILANTAVFGTVLSLDRVLILWRVPHGARAAGLYTIAIMGTSWGLDLAGRIVTVLYTYFQTTLGRTRDPLAVARQAVRATEAQAPLLAAGSAVAYLVGPAFLGALMPRYAEGLPALRPLLPGTVLLGLAWPARQMLITIERPYRLCLATLAGLAVLAVAGTLGADRAGIVGVAWGTSLGYAAVSALTSATAFVPTLGWRAWLSHQARLARTLAWYAAGTILAAHVPDPVRGPLRRPGRLDPPPALDLGPSARLGRAPGSGDGLDARDCPDEARMLDLGFVGLLTIWSAGVGLWTLRRLGSTPEHPADALALAVPLGLGLLGLATLGLAEFSMLDRMGLAIVLALGGGPGRRARAWPAWLAGCPWLGGASDPRSGTLTRARGELPPLARPICSWASPCWPPSLGTLLTALAPVTDGDALCYHLQVPKLFLWRGAAVFDPDLHETVYPLADRDALRGGPGVPGPGRVPAGPLGARPGASRRT